MQDPDAWILPLSSPLCADSKRVGGKASQLHWLSTNGFPVPDARVLGVGAFNAHFEGFDFNEVPPVPDLTDALTQVLEAQCLALTTSESPYVVIRSSALGEDGTSHSFAGQHATYYYIDTPNIGKAVVDCWMSLFSPAALSYRRHLAIAAGRPAMAVIIQRMVHADRSGVCFTEDPTGSRPGFGLIEAAWGLGAALVDGRVSPDRYWIDPEGRQTERRIGRKRLRIAIHLQEPSAARLEPVPLPLQSRAVLSSADVDRIGASARRIARLKGTPQDVEWAFADGEFHLLQSRAVTTQPTDLFSAVDGRWVLFKPLIENFSEPLTPMTVDLLRRVLPPIGTFIHGWYYLNLARLQRFSPRRMDDAALARVLLLRDSGISATWNWTGVLRGAVLLVVGYLSAGAFWSRTSRAPAQGLSVFTAHCESVLADPGCDPLRALQRLMHNRHPLRPVGEFPLQVNIASGRYFLLFGMLKRLLNRLAPGFDQSKLAFLCSGGEGMISRLMVEEIQALGELARTDPEIGSALLERDGDTQALLGRLDPDHPFAAALAGFLQRYGHRTLRELELATPRWREDSTAVLNMIRTAARNPANTHAQESNIDPHGLLLAAQDELHQRLRFRWNRRLVDWLISRIRHYAMLRENSRHYHSMLFDTVRRKLLMMEDQLIAAGRLRCAEDIFFLEYEEALALKAEGLDWIDVEERIRNRRRAYQRRSLKPPPLTLGVDLPAASTATTNGSRLTGDCASPGCAEGLARVILDPGTETGLEPGEILIAPYTDPAWTPLFPPAAAIVVEIGSYLSHAGTVAREFQVPCLVDVNDVTRTIRTGQRLRVNATEGWLEILP